MLDISQVRAQFPSLQRALEDGTRPIFFDNPAGTQVPRAVMDAVIEYYMTMNANSGGAFHTSQQTDAIVRQARIAMADFLNAPSADEIVFGPNMTTLCFALSRALAKTLRQGDEIILTRMDHDANVAPWLHIAQDHGLIVKWVDIITADCRLDLDTLESALSQRTKVVAVVHASNAVGTINPIAHIAQMGHAAGAYVVVDAVQSAPHIPIDVQALGCDFLLCSAYKFFGPHIGILWGRADLLAQLPAYKVRPSKDTIPYRWETGTPSFETIHAVTAAIHYLARLGGEDVGRSESDGTAQRRILKRAMSNVQQYERDLVAQLISGLQSIRGIHIAGITDPQHFDQRVPTVAFIKEGYTPEAIAQYLAQKHIYVWSGNYYALEIMNRLGRGEQGMVRVGLAHYNTSEEVARFLEALDAL